jgi:hypothetical protein
MKLVRKEAKRMYEECFVEMRRSMVSRAYQIVLPFTPTKDGEVVRSANSKPQVK